jgi:hypothetical protein
MKIEGDREKPGAEEGDDVILVCLLYPGQNRAGFSQRQAEDLRSRCVLLRTTRNTK